MTTVTRTFSVDASAPQVIDYLKDFGNAEEWDPGTQSCTREGAGPVGVGARWHNVSKVAGRSVELSYTLESLTEDRIVFVGSNDAATSTDTITVRPDGSGSEVSYHADIEMHGLARLTAPVMKIVMERVGTETERKLTAVLNRLAVSGG